MSQRRGTKVLCDHQAKLHQKNLWKDVTLIFLPRIVNSKQDWFNVNTMLFEVNQFETWVWGRDTLRRISKNFEQTRQLWTALLSRPIETFNLHPALNSNWTCTGFIWIYGVICADRPHVYNTYTFLQCMNAWTVFENMHILYGMCINMAID